MNLEHYLPDSSTSLGLNSLFYAAGRGHNTHHERVTGSGPSFGLWWASGFQSWTPHGSDHMTGWYGLLLMACLLSTVRSGLLSMIQPLQIKQKREHERSPLHLYKPIPSSFSPFFFIYCCAASYFLSKTLAFNFPKTRLPPNLRKVILLKVLSYNFSLVFLGFSLVWEERAKESCGVRSSGGWWGAMDLVIRIQR